VILTGLVCAPAFAQWRANGVPILDTTANTGYTLLQIADDGQGGAIISWRDGRSRKNLDIYAQRIDSNGVAQWRTNGVPVRTAQLKQDFPRMVVDGECTCIRPS
jgi:hypothetical protein